MLLIPEGMVTGRGSRDAANVLSCVVNTGIVLLAMHRACKVLNQVFMTASFKRYVQMFGGKSSDFVSSNDRNVGRSASMNAFLNG